MMMRGRIYVCLLYVTGVAVCCPYVTACCV
jgi:hypothetical protein